MVSWTRGTERALLWPENGSRVWVGEVMGRHPMWRIRRPARFVPKLVTSSTTLRLVRA